MTGWWAPSFDLLRPHHPVSANRVFSHRVQIGRLCRDLRYRFRGLLLSAGVCCLWRRFRWPCLRIQKFRSCRTRLGANMRLLPHGGKVSAALATAGFFGVRYCCGFNPSASNCRLHSAGLSRSRAMLMPRGRRPSTAARTSLGARKASEMVMLT